MLFLDKRIPIRIRNMETGSPSIISTPHLSVKPLLRNVTYFLVALGILVFPLNYKLAGPIRIVDAVFILMTLSVLPIARINSRIFYFGLSFFLILMASAFAGQILTTNSNVEGLFFIYKYAVFFFLPVIIHSIKMNRREVHRLMKLLFISYLLLTGWVYFYQALMVAGYIQGSYRVSFPLSGDYQVSDAHLYSAYLAVFYMCYISYWRLLFEHNRVVVCSLSLLLLPAVLLTGSKTGLVVILVGCLIYLFLKRKYLVLSVFTVIAIFSVSILINAGASFSMACNESDQCRLISRAVTLNLTDDESSLSRINTLVVAFDEIQKSGYLLGVGVTSSTLVWYDGGISSLLAHSGILGLFIFSAYLVKIYISSKKKCVNKDAFISFRTVFFIAIIANLISEYYLVTRFIFPVLLFLSLILIDTGNRFNVSS